MSDYNFIDQDCNNSLNFPIEFELRVIYEIAVNPDFANSLTKLLSELGVSTEAPRALATKSIRYGRFACMVRFENKEAMYRAYEEAAKIPGVKTII